jgi:hypothetical protein
MYGKYEPPASTKEYDIEKKLYKIAVASIQSKEKQN